MTFENPNRKGQIDNYDRKSPEELAAIARGKIYELINEDKYYPMNADDVYMFVEHYKLDWNQIGTDFTMLEFRDTLVHKIKRHFVNDQPTANKYIERVHRMHQRARTALAK